MIVWDGGNNDTSFYQSNLHIVIADPHRPGHEMTYHPGETNVRMADVVVINKVNTADRKDILTVKENVRKLNPDALVIEAASPIKVDDPSMIRGKRGWSWRTGHRDPRRDGLRCRDDCGGGQRGGGAGRSRRYAVGSIAETFDKFTNLGPILPAMGYGEAQVHELEETINNTDCDVVVAGTPIDLNRVIKVNKPIVRVHYELVEIGHPTLEEYIDQSLGPLLEKCDDMCKIL